MNIKAKINVKLISKSRLYEGAKGTYLNCVLIERANEYSDGFIVEEVTTEERQQGVQGAILGNWSYLKPKAEQAQPEPTIKDVQAEPVQNDLPF